MNDQPDSVFSSLFKRMTFTPEQQKRADRQGGGYLRYLRRCKADSEFNSQHYDPLAKVEPEAREAL